MRRLATLGAMPSFRHAPKTLLDATLQQIAQDEARLMKATSDEDRTKLVETLADLHISQDESGDALRGRPSLAPAFIASTAAQAARSHA
jgi:hypothetical protein